MMRYYVIACAALTLASSSVLAGPLFSQPVGYCGQTMSDFDQAVAWGKSQFAADDFTLNAAEPITAVRWWGVYQNSMPAVTIDANYLLPASNFTVRFFADKDGLPGNLLQEYSAVGNCGRELHTLDLPGTAGVHSFEYNYALPAPLALAAGTKYWFSVVDNTATFPDDIFFSWLKTNSPQTPAWCYSFTPGGLAGWNPYTATPGMSFELVPEPASLSIVSLMCLATLCNRRRK